MNDDLVGIGGLLGCIVLLVLYALAIGAKSKQQPSKPLKPIQPRLIEPQKPLTSTNIINLNYYRARRACYRWNEKSPKCPDPSTRFTDPDYWKKYTEWWWYFAD